MKKSLLLLLCFLMLFCCACGAEEDLTGIREDGFYITDGNTANIYVSMTVTTEELTAPVTTLALELKNDTDYVILIKGNPEDYQWEKWTNGRWTAFAVPRDGYILNRALLHAPVEPHSSYTRIDDFSKLPLEAGVYRIRIKYDITTSKEVLPNDNYAIAQAICVAETYLAVSAASVP